MSETVDPIHDLRKELISETLTKIQAAIVESYDVLIEKDAQLRDSYFGWAGLVATNLLINLAYQCSEMEGRPIADVASSFVSATGDMFHTAFGKIIPDQFVHVGTEAPRTLQ